MDTTSIAIGLRGEARRTVTEDLTAEGMGSGEVPVFATPAVLALMEDAACHAVHGALPPGSTTVGVWVDLEHVAASKVGAEVIAVSELVATSGRLLEFTCEARDGDRLVAKARHRRAIVDRERFLSRL